MFKKVTSAILLVVLMLSMALVSCDNNSVSRSSKGTANLKIAVESNSKGLTADYNDVTIEDCTWTYSLTPGENEIGYSSATLNGEFSGEKEFVLSHGTWKIEVLGKSNSGKVYYSGTRTIKIDNAFVNGTVVNVQVDKYAAEEFVGTVRFSALKLSAVLEGQSRDTIDLDNYTYEITGRLLSEPIVGSYNENKTVELVPGNYKVKVTSDTEANYGKTFTDEIDITVYSNFELTIGGSIDMTKVKSLTVNYVTGSFIERAKALLADNTANSVEAAYEDYAVLNGVGQYVLDAENAESAERIINTLAVDLKSFIESILDTTGYDTSTEHGMRLFLGRVLENPMLFLRSDIAQTLDITGYGEFSIKTPICGEVEFEYEFVDEYWDQSVEIRGELDAELEGITYTIDDGWLSIAFKMYAYEYIYEECYEMKDPIDIYASVDMISIIKNSDSIVEAAMTIYKNLMEEINDQLAANSLAEDAAYNAAYVALQDFYHVDRDAIREAFKAKSSLDPVADKEAYDAAIAVLKDFNLEEADDIEAYLSNREKEVNENLDEAEAALATKEFLCGKAGAFSFLFPEVNTSDSTDWRFGKEGRQEKGYGRAYDVDAYILADDLTITFRPNDFKAVNGSHSFVEEDTAKIVLNGDAQLSRRSYGIPFDLKDEFNLTVSNADIRIRNSAFNAAITADKADVYVTYADNDFTEDHDYVGDLDVDIEGVGIAFEGSYLIGGVQIDKIELSLDGEYKNVAMTEQMFVDGYPVYEDAKGNLYGYNKEGYYKLTQDNGKYVMTTTEAPSALVGEIEKNKHMVPAMSQARTEEGYPIFVDDNSNKYYQNRTFYELDGTPITTHYSMTKTERRMDSTEYPIYVDVYGDECYMVEYFSLDGNPELIECPEDLEKVMIQDTTKKLVTTYNNELEVAGSAAIAAGKNSIGAFGSIKLNLADLDALENDEEMSSSLERIEMYALQNIEKGNITTENLEYGITFNKQIIDPMVLVNSVMGEAGLNYDVLDLTGAEYIYYGMFEPLSYLLQALPIGFK